VFVAQGITYFHRKLTSNKHRSLGRTTAEVVAVPEATLSSVLEKNLKNGFVESSSNAFKAVVVARCPNREAAPCGMERGTAPYCRFPTNDNDCGLHANATEQKPKFAVSSRSIIGERGLLVPNDSDEYIITCARPDNITVVVRS